MIRRPPRSTRVRSSAASDVYKRRNPGDDLFSRKAALSVSSALESLTSVFGMGTGVASPLESPGFLASGRVSAGRARLQAQRSSPRIFNLAGCVQSVSRPRHQTLGKVL